MQQIIGTNQAEKLVGDSDVVNLLVDGSFETAKVGANTWTTFKSVGGWQTDSSIEIWGKGFNGVKATDGDKVMELDSDKQLSRVWQDVGTTKGETYTFAFDYAMRPGTRPETNTIEVWWNDEKVGEVRPTTTDWSNAEFSVVGTGALDRIEFREPAGENDSYGGLIDNAVLARASTGVFISGESGDDVIVGTKGSDILLGGLGDDVMYGVAGNNLMFGNSTAVGSVDTERFRISQATTVTATFMFEEAGYKNTLGVYRIAADGTIHNVEILFENASAAGSGGSLKPGESSVTFDVEAGEQLGFFIVPDGYGRNNGSVFGPNRSYEFVDANGNPGNINTTSELRLVSTGPNGQPTVVQSAYGSSVFHSAQGPNNGLNPDKISHVVTEVDSAKGTVTIGFEDLLGGGDKDFDDVVVRLDVGVINAALLPRPSSGTSTSTDNDLMYGGVDDDVMFGMRGDDVMYGGDGNDQMWGNSGNDVMFGGAGNDQMYGGSGDDVLYGGDGDDVIDGNSGDDVIYGGAGNDVLYGSAGNDWISDGDGDDLVYGGSGDDYFLSGEGNDQYFGGSGFDTLDFSEARGGMVIDMSKGTAVGMGNDTFQSIEAIVGSSFADDIKGSKRADVINGGDGDDVIRGMGGEDILTGGAGADRFVFLAKDIVDQGTYLGLNRITDFSMTEGDILDLSRMIPGRPMDVTGIIELAENDRGTIVSVLIGSEMYEVVQLDGLFGLDAHAMVADGAILT
ncbi:MAG: DUF4114 domain-containing protein [Hyphomicrobiaceae bacterium]